MLAAAGVLGRQGGEGKVDAVGEARRRSESIIMRCRQAGRQADASSS